MPAEQAASASGLVPVPSVEGLTYPQAAALLQASGFRVSRTNVAASDIPGMVVWVSPAQALQAAGSLITLGVTTPGANSGGAANSDPAPTDTQPTAPAPADPTTTGQADPLTTSSATTRPVAATTTQATAPHGVLATQGVVATAPGADDPAAAGTQH